jgi:hypothetical protein
LLNNYRHLHPTGILETTLRTSWKKFFEAETISNFSALDVDCNGKLTACLASPNDMNFSFFALWDQQLSQLYQSLCAKLTKANARPLLYDLELCVVFVDNQFRNLAQTLFDRVQTTCTHIAANAATNMKLHFLAKTYFCYTTLAATSNRHAACLSKFLELHLDDWDVRTHLKCTLEGFSERDALLMLEESLKQFTDTQGLNRFIQQCLDVLGHDGPLARFLLSPQ